MPRFSINNFGFRLTLLLHAACISLTIISALSFRPIRDTEKGVTNKAFKDDDEEAKVECNNQKNEINTVPEDKSELFCGFIWLPKINQVFIWKVLKNPLFLVLTFSVITCRQEKKVIERIIIFGCL